MPTGQYFRKIAKSSKVVRTNFEILRREKRDGLFWIEVPWCKHEELTRYFSDIGATLCLRSTLPRFMCKMISEAFRREIACSKCGEPASDFAEYECGHVYARCEAHRDEGDLGEEDFYSHGDHECSAACCARDHAAERKSIAELESLVVPVEISLEEREGGDTPKGKCSFTVRLHHKTDEERARELEYLMMNYLVEEFEGVFKNSIRFDLPPLEEGVKARLAPTFMSWPLVTLAVVRYGKPLYVDALAHKPGGQYVCRLPEGVAIPAHSQKMLDGAYLIELSRWELELAET